MERMLHNTPLPSPSVVSFSPQPLRLRGKRATLRFEPLIFCLDSLSLPADIYIQIVYLTVGGVRPLMNMLLLFQKGGNYRLCVKIMKVERCGRWALATAEKRPWSDCAFLHTPARDELEEHGGLCASFPVILQSDLSRSLGQI